MKKRWVPLVAALLIALALWAGLKLRHSSLAPTHGDESIEKSRQASPTEAPAAGLPPGPANSSPSAAGGNAPAKMNPAEFESLAKKTLESLPLRAELRKLDAEEIEHRTPAILIEAGRKLGSVARALRENPDLRDEAFRFYDACAGHNDLPDTVRALCYSHLRNLDTPEPARYPEHVRELAGQLSP